MKLTINHTVIEARPGEMLIEAAGRAGIHIPSMCYVKGLDHVTSCMLCVVKDENTGKLLPSCSVRAEEGMQIVTNDDYVREARKTALELLLSEHVGDCEAPCRVACPAFMDIPLMNRLIASGQDAAALEVVRRHIALPGVFGRICPAPCEGACKRKPIDGAVSICLLKRFVADEAGQLGVSAESQEASAASPGVSAGALGQITAPPNSPTGKRVAIIGSGPAGLTAAWYLQLQGIAAEIYDRATLPGGSLRYEIPEEELDKKVLDHEIGLIRNAGVVFHMNTLIDAAMLEGLRQSHDAVVLATGNLGEELKALGLEHNDKQLVVNKHTYETSLKGVYAIGNAIRPGRLAIRSAAHGRELAESLGLLFGGHPEGVPGKKFNSTIGRLKEEEFGAYMQEGDPAARQEPSGNSGFADNPGQARLEASRCLHCDCRKPVECKLREYAQEYGAQKRRYLYTDRKTLKKNMQHPRVVYEPGKCIRCGICVRLTALHQETFGFTFIGRGFEVEIGAPFDENLERALEKTAAEVARECPTGALSLRNTETP